MASRQWSYKQPKHYKYFFLRTERRRRINPAPKYSYPQNATKRFMVVSSNIRRGEQQIKSWTTLIYGKFSINDIKNKMAASRKTSNI